MSARDNRRRKRRARRRLAAWHSRRRWFDVPGAVDGFVAEIEAIAAAHRQRVAELRLRYITTRWAGALARLAEIERAEREGADTVSPPDPPAS